MMTTFFLFLNGILMIVMPVLLGWFIASRRQVEWRYFGMGAVTFIASQLLHIPFNWFVLQKLEIIPSGFSETVDLIVLALFLGLSAGVFEEVARYVTYRYWATDARSWGSGLMLGAGHGGIESIILGILALLNVIILFGMKYGYFLQLVPDAQMGLLTEQIDTLFQVPWYMAVLGAMERAFALMAHLAFSVLVLQVFLRGKIRWLVVAILLHALLDATAVFAVQTWGAIPTELLVGLFALFSLGIVFWLRTPEPIEEEPEPLAPVKATPKLELKVTSTHLDESKYS